MHRQRQSTENCEEDERALYLDDEVVHSSVASEAGEASWAPQPQPLTMLSRNSSLQRNQRMVLMGAGMEASQQRTEEHRPKDHGTICTPHPFVVIGDPNSPPPPQLTAASHLTPSLLSLAPAAEMSPSPSYSHLPPRLSLLLHLLVLRPPRIRLPQLHRSRHPLRRRSLRYKHLQRHRHTRRPVAERPVALHVLPHPGLSGPAHLLDHEPVGEVGRRDESVDVLVHLDGDRLWVDRGL